MRIIPCKNTNSGAYIGPGMAAGIESADDRKDRIHADLDGER